MSELPPEVPKEQSPQIIKSGGVDEHHYFTLKYENTSFELDLTGNGTEKNPLSPEPGEDIKRTFRLVRDLALQREQDQYLEFGLILYKVDASGKLYCVRGNSEAPLVSDVSKKFAQDKYEQACDLPLKELFSVAEDNNRADEKTNKLPKILSRLFQRE